MSSPRRLLRHTTLLVLTAAVSCFSPIPTRPTVRQKSISTTLYHSLKTGHEVAKDRFISEQVLVYTLPVTAAVGAFSFYEQTSKAFEAAVQALSQNNWIPVDGGQLIADIILPAINGPVLSSVGLLFATLVATTIGNLYQRQIQITGCLIRQLEDLRRLGYLMASFPQPYRQEGQAELRKKVDYLFEGALAQDIDEENYRVNDMTPIFLLLNRLSNDIMTDDSIKVAGSVLDEGYGLVNRINDHRTTFRSLLVASFPPLHYINLVVLGASVCLIFLIETNRDVMFFLVGFQLRVLWTMLIGTFALMATVIWDLSTPFGGSYSAIRATDEELLSLRAYVTKSWED